VVVAQAPDPRPKEVTAPVEKPKDAAPPAEDKKPKDEVAPPPAEKDKKPKEPDRELVNEGVAPPLPARGPVGRVVTPNVLVVSRPEDAAAWTRLSPEGEQPVTSADQVMALPGFKADVQLSSDVDVHLWGNVPELLPPKPGAARVPMESRVRFHLPQKKIDGKGEDFDADLTVLGGRVYLAQNPKKPKPGGARVRVRVLDQVWDVTLPDPKAEVMVEVTTGFVPGTPAAAGRKPRTEARLAVVRGAADVAMPGRPNKAFPKVPAQTLIAWDSDADRVAGPRPFDKTDPPYEKLLLVESEQGKEVQRALSDMAARVDGKTTVRVLIDERLNESYDPRRATVCRFAAYAKAAITTPATAATDLRPVLDALADPTRPYVRPAAVSALNAWLARDPENPAVLREQVMAKFRTADADADLIVRLFLGYLPPAKAEPADVDKLVELLAHPTLVVRELALWNLLTLVDPEAIGLGLVADVALNTGPGYDKFLRGWKARAEEIKKK
jgi:hypothetical protein